MASVVCIEYYRVEKIRLLITIGLSSTSGSGSGSGTGDAGESWPCDKCGKVYPSKAKLSSHGRVHLKSKYKCEYCGKEFSGPSPLKYHTWIHEGQGIRKFACDYEGCTKKFKSAQDLRRHHLVHNGTRPFQCDKCDRAFNLEWVLREHKKIHEGIRPFKCDVEDCGKSFYSQKDLKRHQVIHGNETPFKCTRGECLVEKKGFRRKDNFLRHLMAVHNLPKDEAKMVADEVESTGAELKPEERMAKLQLQHEMPNVMTSPMNLFTVKPMDVKTRADIKRVKIIITLYCTVHLLS